MSQKNDLRTQRNATVINHTSSKQEKRLGNSLEILRKDLIKTYGIGIRHESMHWTARGLRDPSLTEGALAFVQRLLNAPIERIALENPVSVISSRIRKPDQIIQPYMFGEDASKKTCLWLKNLPLLQATHTVEPRVIGGKKRWGNQCDSGQNALGPSEARWKERSRTYQGIANAMAEQWSIE